METSMYFYSFLTFLSMCMQSYRCTLRSLTETYDIHELKLQPFLNTLIKPGIKRFKARLNLLTETLIGTLVG